MRATKFNTPTVILESDLALATNTGFPLKSLLQWAVTYLEAKLIERKPDTRHKTYLGPTGHFRNMLCTIFFNIYKFEFEKVTR